MVAKVISGQDIKGALNYNEQKVLQGTAQCIHASGFMKDTSKLNFYDKLTRFTDLNDRNTRTKTNTLHISLNFDPGERLDVDDLNRIASVYMDKIGFGDQPFLVYEHKDAAHPHIHIVTTLIREDGKRIPIHYLGKNDSEKARKEIEQEFGLVKAEGQKKSQNELIHPVDVQKAIYGESETRRSISNVVRMVTRSYKYASLPELNAALRQYNVTANRGTEKSRMFEKKGLIYSLIDEKGKQVGIPVKASALYGKPTLAFLEKQFRLNEVLRQPHKEPLKRSVEIALRDRSVTTRPLFAEALEKKGIAVIFRTNTEGRTYGITFVDNRSRVVFNGSTLGKPYSAGGILEKLSAKEDTIQPYRPGFSGPPVSFKTEAMAQITDTSIGLAESMVRDLISADGFDPVSPETALRLKKRKRKRKGHRL